MNPIPLYIIASLSAITAAFSGLMGYLGEPVCGSQATRRAYRLSTVTALVALVFFMWAAFVN